jgi:hypothetical protein
VIGTGRRCFPQATQAARDAIEMLKAFQIEDRKEKEEEANARQRAEREQRERQEQAAANRAAAERLEAREKLLGQFLTLHTLDDPRARGYSLEGFLNSLFEYEGLKPRGPFKIVGEQIDGSFTWGHRTHLIEARWVKEPVAGLGFSSLMYKIEGKTADTRGLFVSINGYSREALRGLTGKGELRFVCIDGAHITRCLSPGSNLDSMLEEIWRLADETGEAYLPVDKMRR